MLVCLINLFNIRNVGFLRNIVWPVLAFHVDLGQILPHHAQAEHDQATYKDDDTDERRPTSYRITPEQLSDDHDQEHDKGHAGHEDPHPR